MASLSSALRGLKNLKKLFKGKDITLKSGRVPYATRREALKKYHKDFFELPEPTHFKTRTGKAARFKRETLYKTNPQAPFLAGLLMSRKAKTQYNRTVRKIDELLGQLVTKPGQKKGIFIDKEYARIPGTNKYVKHYFPSITAPVKKTSEFAAPMLSSMYIMDLLSKKKKNTPTTDVSGGYEYPYYEKVGYDKEGSMEFKDRVLVPKEDLEKTAAALRIAKRERDEKAEMEKKAEKTSRAHKVAFEMVEQGRIPPFKSYADFQEKIASLIGEDLDVVEKALQFDSNRLSLGELGDNVKGTNAIEQFVLED